MIKPLVSCVIPVFNGERYLTAAIDSIIAQTYQPVEVIVVDDGSTDGTARLVAGYGAQVRNLFQPNGGPAAARNLGIEAAQGELIAFLDADDLWHEDKLAHQVARVLARPGLEICVTHIQNFWSAELGAAQIPPSHPRLLQPWAGYTCSTLLARQPVFAKLGRFDPQLRLGEDGAWFAQAGRAGAMIEVLPQVLAYRRLHQSNLTRLQAAGSREALLLQIKAEIDHRRGR